MTLFKMKTLVCCELKWRAQIMTFTYETATKLITNNAANHTRGEL